MILNNDNIPELWDIVTGEKIQDLPDYHFPDKLTALSKDGSKKAKANKKIVELFDEKTQQLLNLFLGHDALYTTKIQPHLQKATK